VPTQTPVQRPRRHYNLNGWDRLEDVSYRGWPVYVSRYNGAVAYEEAGTQLVSLPEDVEDAVLNILLGDWAILNMTPEARHGLAQRAN
jgi:hypothetical protein